MDKKNVFCLISILSLVILASSARGFEPSEASKHLIQLQKEFQNATPMHTIVYIDREIIQQKLNALEIDHKKQPELRNDVIAQFVQERVGITLDKLSSDTIGDYYSAEINVAVPTENRETGQAVCAVLGANPKTTAREEVERLLYWQEMKDKAPEYKGKEIKKIASKQEFSLMADLHETFHCMDPYYIPKQKTNEYENESTVHRAESFAEVGALLYLAQKGFANLSKNRVLYRIIGSFMVGRHGEEFFGPNLFSGINFGVVYSFYPAMMATQRSIDQGLKPMSLTDIQNLAHDIVEDNAIPPNMAHAMAQYQLRPESLDHMITQFREDKNEGLRKKFREVEKYRDEYIEVLEWAFSELF